MCRSPTLYEQYMPVYVLDKFVVHLNNHARVHRFMLLLHCQTRSVLQATAHWESERHQVLSTEAVRSIVNNARQIKQMLPPQSPLSHNHQLSHDATRRRSIDAPPTPTPPSIVQINVLDAPHFRLPNQENRLALVLDPTNQFIPFTFGVEMFPPGVCFLLWVATSS